MTVCKIVKKLISANFYLKSKLECAPKEDCEKINGYLLVELSLGSQVRHLGVRLSKIFKIGISVQWS